MTRPFQAPLLDTLPVLIAIRALRKRQPAPLHMRLHVLPQSCLSILSRVSPHFMRLLRCVPQIQRRRRVCPPATSSLRKQAPKSSLYPTISRYQFARANRHRRLPPQKCVQLKYRQNTMMRSVAANRTKLSSQKVFKLRSPNRSNEKSLHPLKSYSPRLMKRWSTSSPLHQLWRYRCLSQSPSRQSDLSRDRGSFT
jgi:hypothetical protein